MSMPEQKMEQERIQQHVQRSVGLRALKEIRDIVDEDLREEEARARSLRAFLRYGWAILLLVALLMAYYLGVI